MERPKANFYRKPGGGYIRPNYHPAWLMELGKRVPSFQGNDRTYGLALLILQHFFGHDWLEKHVLDEPQAGFLARHIDGTDAGATIVCHRIRDLAEMILNLGGVGGVEAPFEQIANGQIESGYAELEVGRLLTWAQQPFRFVWASGVAGQDFDIEVIFPNGVTVCADTKCKIEVGAFSANGIRNTLDGARKKNLPKDRPGAIFLKIPSPWFEDNETWSAVEAACEAFFRGTRRVVTVSVFATKLSIRDGMLTDQHFGRDLKNVNHEYEPALNWRIFSYTQKPLACPIGWARLADFLR